MAYGNDRERKERSAYDIVDARVDRELSDDDISAAIKFRDQLKREKEKREEAAAAGAV